MFYWFQKINKCFILVKLTTVRITLKYVYKEYILSTNTSLHLVQKKKKKKNTSLHLGLGVDKLIEWNVFR